MISPEDRFWVVAEAIRGDVHRGYIIDWDQRRWYLVCGPKKLLPPDEEKEIGMLERYINKIPSNAHTITVDDKGSLTSVSTDPEDDPTIIPYYPHYSEVATLQDCPAMALSNLDESDRLGPGVDLMSYVDNGHIKNVVFKYSMITQWTEQIWKEMHLIKNFRHPNLVEFDHVIIDDVESRVLGFTTVYIPGGSLDQERTRIFRFQWLRQLISVVDYLNLDLGFIHQDIAPRNLLIDPTTNKIKLFDFDRAAPASQADPARNDITGVIFTLYEIVTEDSHFREMPFAEQDPQKVQRLKEWPVRCKLDSDVTRFREHLDNWVQKRRDNRDVLGQTQRPQIPEMPPPSPLLLHHSETGEPFYNTSNSRRRADMLKLKKGVVIWDRPPLLGI